MEDGLQKREVLEEKLFLEVLGAGGDDDALAALAGEAKGGEEVGEGFAGAGAGLDDKVAVIVEGGLDGSGHLVLAGAVLECEGRLGEEAAGGEEVVEGGKLAGLVLGVFVGGSGRDLDGGGHVAVLIIERPHRRSCRYESLAIAKMRYEISAALLDFDLIAALHWFSSDASSDDHLHASCTKGTPQWVQLNAHDSASS